MGRNTIRQQARDQGTRCNHMMEPCAPLQKGDLSLIVVLEINFYLYYNLNDLAMNERE